jgi:DNA-binding NtrC family response regulator
MAVIAGPSQIRERRGDGRASDLTRSPRVAVSPPDPRVPSLTVLHLSNSFSAVWTSLAEDAMLRVHDVTEVADLGRRAGTIAVIAAGGEVSSVEALLRASPVPGLEVAVVGGIPSHRLAVQLMRAGASEYFALPMDLEMLRSWVRERAERQRTRASARAFAVSERAKFNFAGILGESAALRAALDRAARVIPHSNVTVLITGETGTGKELLARAIHYNGPRRDAPFVDINCAAIPEHLLESELFGHEKGAFTDATTTKAGLFEMAHNGTLFLDEIGHLALPLQGKVLRALEERQIRRVGGMRSIPIDVRVVAATHVDLAEASRQGRFREDLYYRLNVVPLELPPLRARRSDIVLLARHFLARFANEYHMAPPSLTAAAEQALSMHAWSGNVRELRNVIERAVLLSEQPHIDVGSLALGNEKSTARRDGSLPFPTTLAALSRAAVDEMLRLCNGNKSEAARQLGISRPRLLRMLDGDPSLDPSDVGVYDA